MTTEDMIEDFIRLGIKAYKKNSRGSAEAGRLDRHETITVEGNEFSCWREYVIYRMAEYIQRILPDETVEVELDGNDSTIHIELTDEEQKLLNRKMFLFLEENGGGRSGK